VPFVDVTGLTRRVPVPIRPAAQRTGCRPDTDWTDMTDRPEFTLGYRLEHRLLSGSPRVLGAASNLTVAYDSALRWRRLLRRLGGTGIVAVVNAATGAAVSVVRVDGSPW